ncbi:hypothetical protein [Microcystis sp. LEGE 08355]|uniref:hypothetical protein n=1 Tax=Microcystis sp. LEGE 08355 TaxID=1828687 RepID=UPI00187F4EAA|nr:hypothetical protein [Microcystis sp. LEGE 08355]MBE9073944.1 hypothetical protein [Microcystis sp. LEGE 08355]
MVKNVVSFLFVTVDKNYTTSGIKLMIEINDYGKNTLIWLKFPLFMLREDGEQITESKEKGDGVLSFVLKLPIGRLNAVQLINNYN